jgi:hypothetical protein
MATVTTKATGAAQFGPEVLRKLEGSGHFLGAASRSLPGGASRLSPSSSAGFSGRPGPCIADGNTETALSAQRVRRQIGVAVRHGSALSFCYEVRVPLL